MCHRGASHAGWPGLLESVYQEALAWELERRSIDVCRELELPLVYRDHPLARRFRIDLLVGGKVIVECKAAAQYHPIFASRS